ncbi:hypothetical protein DFH06DRAFT_1118242 [Mycena polygramma]|nr:hypothetical protein DFH06DRAFT_1118242 [Mycena polygramma]
MHFHAFPKVWGQKPLARAPSPQDLLISCGRYAASSPVFLGTVRMQLKGKRTCTSKALKEPPRHPESVFPQNSTYAAQGTYRRTYCGAGDGRMIDMKPLICCMFLNQAVIPPLPPRTPRIDPARRSLRSCILKTSAKCNFNMVRMQTVHIFRHYLDPFPRINRTYVKFVSAALGVPWTPHGNLF